MAVKLKAKPD